MATKVPFLQDDPLAEAAWAEIDYIWNAQKAFGLKAAHVADGLAASMLSSEDWHRDSIECEIQEITEDEVTVSALRPRAR